jgi:adenylate cyclase
MAAALESAQRLRETFGQFVSPDVRDEILRRHPGLGGEVAEVTVLFADMRGSTRRSAGVEPARAVELLNRFLSLAVAAVEENGGWVNKFLGDGVMALFGAPRPQADHADAALAAARTLAARLETLNRELGAQGGERLDIGIGIHTGPALVGCIGASIEEADGTRRVRREFTAVGDTVNACQRIEQLTKTLGGRILLSEETRKRLANGAGLAPVGLQTLTGFDHQVLLHRLET